MVLEHEQIVGWLRYECLTSIPRRLYGAGIGSRYPAQGVQLGKQFRPYIGACCARPLHRISLPARARAARHYAVA